MSEVVEAVLGPRLSVIAPLALSRTFDRRAAHRRCASRRTDKAHSGLVHAARREWRRRRTAVRTDLGSIPSQPHASSNDIGPTLPSVTHSRASAISRLVDCNRPPLPRQRSIASSRSDAIRSSSGRPGRGVSWGSGMSAPASMICVKRSRVIESGARVWLRGSMERVYTKGEEFAYKAATRASPGACYRRLSDKRVVARGRKNWRSTLHGRRRSPACTSSRSRSYFSRLY